MVNWPTSLVREIAERRVVIFVGAGISKNTHISLPNWAGLLTNMATALSKARDRTLVGQLVRKERMLDAAQIITEGTPQADLSAKVREIFQIRPAPRNALYKNLLDMDPKTIITTNYDEFLEKNFEHFSGGMSTYSISRHESHNLIDDLRSPIRSIVKMHGCVTMPNDIVLDRASYFYAKRNNQGFFATISALMTVNTVLFIGYSITDPDIQLILENVNINNHARHPHYALMEKFEHNAIKNAVAKTYNISVIEYPLGDYASVPASLDELSKQVAAVRLSRGIV